MADIDRIRAEIAEISQRPKAVTFAEVERIIQHLGSCGFDVESKAGRHSHLFRVNDERFTVCKHNPRRKELKSVYVRAFLSAMTALDLLEGPGETNDTLETSNE